MGLRKLLTGPTREEMGMPPVEDAEVPHVIDPPVPYKPGTEKAQFVFAPEATTVRDRVTTILLTSVPLLVILIGIVYSLSTH